MSLSTILNTAASGLLVSQAGLRTVSDNIANVNTPGYVRKEINQVSIATAGIGAGVDIEGIRRVVDRYLQTASLSATSSMGRTGVLAEVLDRVQGLFGNPATGNNLFGRLDATLTEFSALANDPSSSLQRSEALNALETFLEDASRISISLSDLRNETDTRIAADVDRANALLSEVARLNSAITAAGVAGGDTTGAENVQAQLVNELAGLLDIRMTPRATGGVTLRTLDGMVLADDAAGTLTWNRSDTAAGYLTVAPPSGQAFEARVTSGSIVGQIEVRDREIPSIQAQLAEFVGGFVREINAVHNAHSAVPAPQTLSGKNTGLDVATAISGFSGTTTVAITDAAGVITRRVAITFNGSGGDISVNGGPPTAFAGASFATALNTALGAFGTASFSNGALTIAAASGGGVAIGDDPTAPADKGGQGFSQYFGLNDLVRSAVYAPFDTGLTAASSHGFTAGQTITFRISDPQGARLRDVAVSVPAGATMGDLLTALNAPMSGVGDYGSFSLDAAGRMTFAPTAVSGARLSVVQDSTQRAGGGPSLSALFGIGPDAMAQAAMSYSIPTAIRLNPARLATARLDLSAVGIPALALGDGRGALDLASVGETVTRFASTGAFPATNVTVSQYATEFAGGLGRRSASAEAQLESDDALYSEAENRRSAFEGVNMDEELIRLTTYQQAFNASARLIQAANDLYDTLLSIL